MVLLNSLFRGKCHNGKGYDLNSVSVHLMAFNKIMSEFVSVFFFRKNRSGIVHIAQYPPNIILLKK